jgi:ankyrin repeat protein
MVLRSPILDEMQNETGNVVEAIRTGGLAELGRLLSEHPQLARERVDGQRTLLHVATDWPGHFPNVRETISVLAAHGADLNAPFQGRHSETPLHWAASSDDVDALDALLDHGANIEATGSVIGGGTPLADAVAFGQWRAARRLVERGARSTIWQAAALGLMERVQECLLAQEVEPEAVTNAFWCACHGGQLAAAKYLLERGADLNWVGYDGLSPLDAAVRNGNSEVIDWLRASGATSAKPL